MSNNMKRPARAIDEASRFWSKVDKRGPDECWLWMNRTHPVTGYGEFRFRGATSRAHRVAYILTHGEIPEGLELDHACPRAPCREQRRCCNPAHLEPVTHQENKRRERERNFEHVTHCPQGHAFDEKNTHYTKTGARQCRRCRYLRVRRREIERLATDPEYAARRREQARLSAQKATARKRLQTEAEKLHEVA